MADTKPWLDYNGETTAELLAHKKTHRIDSLLCAFEWGIEAKHKPNAEERVVLSIMALDREVNNGGFSQFFTNSSKSYAPKIVQALQTVGATETSDLTARAIGALKIAGKITEKAVDQAMDRPSPAREEALDELDQEFYQSRRSLEIEEKLFAFIEAHAEKIEIGGVPAPKVGAQTISATAVLTGELFASEPRLALEPVLEAARKIVNTRELAVTEEELTGVAHAYLLLGLVDQKRWDECAAIGEAVIRSARTDAAGEMMMWAEGLVEAQRKADADRWTLAFIKSLSTSSNPLDGETVECLLDFVKENAKSLPESAAFCKKAFSRGKRKP